MDKGGRAIDRIKKKKKQKRNLHEASVYTMRQ